MRHVSYFNNIKQQKQKQKKKIKGEITTAVTIKEVKIHALFL